MTRKLNICRSIIIWITIIGGFICWLLIPNITSVHFGITFTPDRIGNKAELLVLLILPLFAYVPFSIPELHTESEENKLKIMKKKKSNALAQLIIALILSLFVWIPLLTAL
jgi:hypothetical protein